MKTTLIRKKSDKILSPKTTRLSGVIRTTVDIDFQPFGQLIKHGEDQNPLNASASLGLVLNNRILIDNEQYLEVSSRTECVLFYSDPENEKEVFKDFVSQAVNFHIDEFNKHKSKTVFRNHKAPDELLKKSNQIYESLYNYFHNLFSL